MALTVPATSLTGSRYFPKHDAMHICLANKSEAALALAGASISTGLSSNGTIVRTGNAHHVVGAGDLRPRPDVSALGHKRPVASRRRPATPL